MLRLRRKRRASCIPQASQPYTVITDEGHAEVAHRFIVGDYCGIVDIDSRCFEHCRSLLACLLDVRRSRACRHARWPQDLSAHFKQLRVRLREVGRAVRRHRPTACTRELHEWKTATRLRSFSSRNWLVVALRHRVFCDMRRRCTFWMLRRAPF